MQIPAPAQACFLALLGPRLTPANRRTSGSASLTYNQSTLRCSCTRLGLNQWARTTASAPRVGLAGQRARSVEGWKESEVSLFVLRTATEMTAGKHIFGSLGNKSICMGRVYMTPEKQTFEVVSC